MLDHLSRPSAQDAVPVPCSDLPADPGASGVRLFDTADDVEQHLRSDTYPWRNQTSSEMLCGAVIFDTEPWSQQARTG